MPYSNPTLSTVDLNCTSSCHVSGKRLFTRPNPFYQLNSVFNNLAVPERNWLCTHATLSRLHASLQVLATGHLNCAENSGTHFSNRNRGAVPFAVESHLDDNVRRFTLALSNFNKKDNIKMKSPSDTALLQKGFIPESGVNILEVVNMRENSDSKNGRSEIPLPSAFGMLPPASVMTSPKRGDFCLLHSDRVAVPNPGEAATASLEDILGRSHVLLQPECLLKKEVLDSLDLMEPAEGVANMRSRARAHAFPGEWKKVVQKMSAAGMCTFKEVGTVYENSVFGVLKKPDVMGPHRLIFSGDVANKFFAYEAGAVELPHPDVISNLYLAEGCKLYLASSDISQCYNRLKVPEWLRRYLGMPQVWSSDVGVGGPRRLVVPVLTVLPMGIIPAVRLCQEVTLTICKLAGNDRILTHQGPFEISDEKPLLDVIYLDDISTLGSDVQAVNDRSMALAEKCAEFGLPTEESKKVTAIEGCDGEALGLRFQQGGLLSVTPAYFQRLGTTTEQILCDRRCSPRHMAEVIGGWVYACLLKRPTLSVLSCVYDFTRCSPYDKARVVPMEALRELSILLDLAPTMSCNLSLPVSGRVYATDASKTGAGVTYRDSVPASDLMILRETRIRKGWQERLRETEGREEEASISLVVSDSFTEFFERCPFKVAIASKWTRKAHINSLELEALLLAIRHARRSPSTTLRRINFGLDSTVALGVSRKGRSSAVALNRIARRLCANLIWGGIQAEYFWIPTKLMPADEASRR